MTGRFSALDANVQEGAFASRAVFDNLERRFPSLLSPNGSAYVAAPGGTLLGRFGWANPNTGFVSNVRVTAQDALGLALPQSIRGGVMGNNFTWQVFDRVAKSWRLRAGLPITVMTGGNFWVRFAAGAFAGQPCFASSIDGSAISGASSGAEQTRWNVVSNAEPGRMAQISSSAFFGP